jgi:hypothetical protein
LNTSTFSRFAFFVAVFTFTAISSVVANAATFGPGGGIPSPIGQAHDVAFGPGGGIPSPIGQRKG